MSRSQLHKKPVIEALLEETKKNKTRDFRILTQEKAGPAAIYSDPKQAEPEKSICGLKVETERIDRLAMFLERKCELNKGTSIFQ